MRADRKNVEEQYQLVLACRHSGLTDSGWCREHGINPDTFSTWIRRLKKKGGFHIPQASKQPFRGKAAHDIVRVDVLPEEGHGGSDGDRDKHEWAGYASDLLNELKAGCEIEAGPHTLTRLMNAHITELANDYGVLYRSGKRDGRGRRVYLREIHEECVANVGNEAISNDGAGSENIYNSYNTVTDGPEGT